MEEKNKISNEFKEADKLTEIDKEKRDFLYLTTTGLAAAGGIVAGWTLIDTMNPAKDVLALASTEVDLSAVEIGQSLTVMWRGKPVFIRRRTQVEIDSARAVDIKLLPDQASGNKNIIASDASDLNRTLDPEGEWLVMIGVCTHLGCVPLGDAGDFGGWFCPCHGSHYDTAGRIRKGPAPRNLDIPVAKFIGDDIIKLG